MINSENTIDLVVEKKVGKRVLKMHASHMLPIYYEKYPNYDRALPRISKKIKKIDGYLNFIDVGANIGDTVSLVSAETEGSFLCIEGDSKYIPFLRENINNLKNIQVFIEECYCAEKSHVSKNMTVNRGYGSARLEKGGDIDADGVILKSLDDIIKKHSSFSNINLLKIDTDGFDMNVLKGAKSVMKNFKPLIYFEFDPELYKLNNQEPLKVFDILSSNGYQECLLYDNFGIPIEIIKTTDSKEIDRLIQMIDKNKIYYFDVLTFHHSMSSKYGKVLYDELHFGIVGHNDIMWSAQFYLKGVMKRILKFLNIQ